MLKLVKLLILSLTLCCFAACSAEEATSTATDSSASTAQAAVEATAEPTAAPTPEITPLPTPEANETSEVRFPDFTDVVAATGYYYLEAFTSDGLGFIYCMELTETADGLYTVAIAMKGADLAENPAYLMEGLAFDTITFTDGTNGLVLYNQEMLDNYSAGANGVNLIYWYMSEGEEICRFLEVTDELSLYYTGAYVEPRSGVYTVVDDGAATGETISVYFEGDQMRVSYLDYVSDWFTYLPSNYSAGLTSEEKAVPFTNLYDDSDVLLGAITYYYDDNTLESRIVVTLTDEEEYNTMNSSDYTSVRGYYFATKADEIPFDGEYTLRYDNDGLGVIAVLEDGVLTLNDQYVIEVTPAQLIERNYDVSVLDTATGETFSAVAYITYDSIDALLAGNIQLKLYVETGSEFSWTLAK